jgi:hypothetical protein
MTKLFCSCGKEIKGAADKYRIDFLSPKEHRGFDFCQDCFTTLQEAAAVTKGNPAVEELRAANSKLARRLADAEAIVKTCSEELAQYRSGLLHRVLGV